MRKPTFLHLNADWNAEPNTPLPEATVEGSTVKLRFVLDAWAYAAADGELGFLTFDGCSRWRLGPANDEEWHDGACRYSRLAPEWGEFYEILDEDAELRLRPGDWRTLGPAVGSERHFLFYMHDETFECLAVSWRFRRESSG
ncbi:MAG TPA: hypothetical protein VK446_11780 [Methylocystis sp.]|nr:hypothetical protein [Methylocystis sp.]